MRQRIALLTAATLALGGLAVTPQAHAAKTGNPFQIDKQVPDGVAVRFADPSGNSQELGPLNASATKLGVIHTAQPPMLGTTNPNAQVDLSSIWLATATNVSTPAAAGDDGDTWLYFAWQRDSNKGSGVIMYEFMKDQEPVACDYTRPQADLIATCNPWANRQDGDFILVWDQQGTTINVILRTWRSVNGTLTLDAGTSLTGNGNAFATTSADNFFGEAAVNLSQTVFKDVVGCEAFGNVIPGTVTGNSDTADYKDTVLADVSSFITISNCGSVRVTKATVPAGGTGQFAYTLDRSGAPVRYASDGYSSAEQTAATGTLTGHGDSDTVIDLIAGSDYRLVEADPGPRYVLTSIACTLNGATYDAIAGSFPVVAGATTSCTITNTLQRGTLIVRKVVVNDNGGTSTAGSFSFSVNGAPAVSFEADGQNDLSVEPGTYTVTEPAVAGYATTYSNCQAVVVDPGETETCTITNDDTKAAPTGTTVQSWVLQDALTITGLRTGAPDASGASVVFRVYSDAACSVLVGSETDPTVVGSAASTTTGVPVSRSGTYRWTAQYSGDQYNSGFTTACGDEITEIKAKDQGRDDFSS